MRPEVLKAWQDILVEHVSEALPQFAPYAKRERGEDRGMIRYAWDPSPALRCFVLFRPIDSEAFDAWVGWSVDGKCPYALPRHPKGFDDFAGPHAICCSMDLVPRNGLAHWNFWQAPDALVDDPAAFARAYAEHALKRMTSEQAREFVAASTRAGVREVLEYGVPYLERRVAHGVGR